MSTVMSILGEKLYALNPSLLNVPPSQEGSANDVCYLGPDGSTDAVVHCGDLQDGIRPNVATWYISPEQHVRESILALVLFGSLLSLVKPILSRALHTHEQTATIQHPFFMKPLVAFCFATQTWYKLQGHTGKVFFMMVPCNMIWTLDMSLCFGPASWQPVALEMVCSYISLALIAVATPDTADCILPGETIFFYFHHAMLLIIPFVYIWNGSITMRTSLLTHFCWWVTACSFFALFYFPIITICSVKTGLNLNYMMHPPPNQDLLQGHMYRQVSTGLCAIAFALSRIVVLAVELVIPKQLQPKRLKQV